MEDKWRRSGQAGLDGAASPHYDLRSVIAFKWGNIMVVEAGILSVKVGGESGFEAAVARARHVLDGAPGCRGAQLRRGVEHPSTYLLTVEWDSVEDHLAFAASDDFAVWIGAIGDFLAGPPDINHYGEPASPPLN